MINTNQMELGFDKQSVTPEIAQRQRRLSRAQWWFKQMHRVVDLAMEWKPAPPARPEQVYFALAPKRS
jgi:hypothetical protein